MHYWAKQLLMGSVQRQTILVRMIVSLVLSSLFFTLLKATTPIVIDLEPEPGTEELNTGPQAITSNVDTLDVNGDWKFFQFGEAGVPARPRFEFVLGPRSEANFEYDACVVHIVDLYCYGDEFGFIDNSNPEFLPVTTGSYNCPSNTSDPDSATEDSGYSQTLGIILRGAHNITIIPRQSPYGGGTAAIRLVTGLLANQAAEKLADTIERIVRAAQAEGISLNTGESNV